MKIVLNNNNGFSWNKTNNLFFKGYFYDGDSNFYEKNEAVKFFESIKNTKDLRRYLEKINGVFSVMITFEKETYIFSDITRSFPIFYTKQNNELFLSDDIQYLKTTMKLNEFDPISEIEFKASNHTYGKKTLLKNVFQIQASECLIIKNESIVDRFFNYSYAIRQESSATYSELKNELIASFENSFQRFIKSLKNKTAVIPLSGGFDSRLIATMLKKYNYKNVVCFTYGNKNSFEIENSKKTAKILNFKWYFIEYSAELIGDYLNTSVFLNYAHFAGKLTSMPNLQEYFAVKYLKEHQLIPQDSIFIPGYAGDLLGGSQLLKVIPADLKHEQIIDLFIDKKFPNYHLNLKEKNIIREFLAVNLLKIDKEYKNKIPSTVFEDFDIKEKIAKYIFNSAHFYTYFGYEFRFPFWDKELLNFFKKVPFEYKKMKLLFDDVLNQHYFTTHQVTFKTELQPSEAVISFQKIKGKIRPFLPTFMKRKLLQKNDWINYKPITDQMTKQVAKKGLKFERRYHDYNEIITQWYLFLSKNELK